MSSADLLARNDRRAAVLGSPIAHSLSPVMHRAAYAALGLTGWAYDRIEVDAAGLPAVVTASGPEWVGFSVTMPGKAAAADVADRRSDRVAVLGVANTLVRRSDGWYAENTDVDGIIGALRAAGVPDPARVLILGGGGTALAAVSALAELGAAEIAVAGRAERSTAAARQLAAVLGVPAKHIQLEDTALASVARTADLLVSVLPAGIADPFAPAVAAVPVLFDAIYHPWPTVLASSGRPNRTIVTGLDMLLHQAFRQVELMTGEAAPRAAMRSALAEAVPGLPLPI